MQPQTITDQILDNKAYNLQIETQGDILTIKLKLKISKKYTYVYQRILKSLKDVDKLEDNFQTLDKFKQYIKDPRNIQVVLENSVIHIFGNFQRSNQIAIIKLQFLNLFDKEKDEEQFVRQILINCSSNKYLNEQETKFYLKNIAVCLSDNIKQKKQNKRIRKQQQLEIRNLINQVEDSKRKNEEKHLQGQFQKNKIIFVYMFVFFILVLIGFYSFQAKLEQMEEQFMKKLDEQQLNNIEARINKQLKDQKKKLQNRINHLTEKCEGLTNQLQKIQASVNDNQTIINYPESDGRLRYEGQVKNGKKEGKGILFWKDGDKYEGQFKDNRYHGSGNYMHY